MSKFGFNPDEYRDTLAQTGAARQVTRVIDDALRQSGALDKPLDYALWYAGLTWADVEPKLREWWQRTNNSFEITEREISKLASGGRGGL